MGEGHRGRPDTHADRKLTTTRLAGSFCVSAIAAWAQTVLRHAHGPCHAPDTGRDLPSTSLRCPTKMITMRVDFDPAEMAPNEFYTRLTATVVPRLIAWVSTMSPDGTAHLAPARF